MNPPTEQQTDRAAEPTNEIEFVLNRAKHTTPKTELPVLEILALCDPPNAHEVDLWEIYRNRLDHKHDPNGTVKIYPGLRLCTTPKYINQ